MIPGETHIKMRGDSISDWTPEGPWEPLSNRKDVVKRSNVPTAPGFVITNGCHDSCWRDHGMTLRGWPRVFRNFYEDRNGEQAKNYTDTVYFPWYKAEDVRVYSVKISGPTKGFWGEAPDPTLCDSEWVNPDPENLVGVWALIAATASLRHCAGKKAPSDVWQISFDSSFDYYRPTKDSDPEGVRNNRTGKTKTSSRRNTAHYRFNREGMVVAVGKEIKKKPFGWDVIWTETEEPFYLDRETHLRNVKCSAKKIKDGMVGIHFMWQR